MASLRLGLNTLRPVAWGGVAALPSSFSSSLAPPLVAGSASTLVSGGLGVAGGCAVSSPPSASSFHSRSGVSAGGVYGASGLYGAGASSVMMSGGGGVNHGTVFGETMYATTILSVRKNDVVAVVGDGQVTQGSQVVKPNAKKVRRIGSGEDVITGFAGATADAMALLERLEMKLDTYPNQLTRACVELAKDWRTEKYLKQLQAVMLVADSEVSLTVTGTGDVIEPHDGIIAIGSGGAFALAAARALIDTDLDAMEICEKAMLIAADMCVYTNTNFVKDQLPDIVESESSSTTDEEQP